MPFRISRRALLAGSLARTVTSQQSPSIAVRNGRIWTGDPARPWARSLVCQGARVVALDTDPPRGARVLNAQGALVVPGFIDSHVHFVTGGFRLSSVQLRDAAGPVEFSRRIAAYAQTVPPGTWITGGDWDHERWGGELPRRDWIDTATPRHPVWVNRLDGHMALANSAALAAAKVTRDTADVDGGTIVRDADRNPTGVLKDNAMALVDKAQPDPTPLQQDRAVAAAMRYVAAQGVTGVHHVGSWGDLAVFRRAHAVGTLRTRIYAAVPLDTWSRLADEVRARGRGHDWLRIGGLKCYVDGSLGSHTAAFLEPFTDAPNDAGLLSYPAGTAL